MVGGDSEDDDGNSGVNGRKGIRFSEIDLAELEAEAFVLGIWKNFEDLEEAISIPELELILETKRESAKREMYFQASLQGVDLYGQEVKERKRKLTEEAYQEAYGTNMPEPELSDLFTLEGVDSL